MKLLYISMNHAVPGCLIKQKYKFMNNIIFISHLCGFHDFSYFILTVHLIMIIYGEKKLGILRHT